MLILVRQTNIDSLTEEIKTIEADEEDDKAMGREPEPDQVAENAEVSLRIPYARHADAMQRKTKLNWRALRLASHNSLRHFPALSAKREVQLVLQSEKKDEERAAAPRQDQTDAVNGQVDDMDHDGKTQKDDAADDEDGLVLKTSEVEVAEAVERGEVQMEVEEPAAELNEQGNAVEGQEQEGEDEAKEEMEVDADGEAGDTARAAEGDLAGSAELEAEGEGGEAEGEAEEEENPPTPPLDELPEPTDAAQAAQDVDMEAVVAQAEEPIEVVPEEDAELVAE